MGFKFYVIHNQPDQDSKVEGFTSAKKAAERLADLIAAKEVPLPGEPLIAEVQLTRSVDESLDSLDLIQKISDNVVSRLEKLASLKRKEFEEASEKTKKQSELETIKKQAEKLGLTIIAL